MICAAHFIAKGMWHIRGAVHDALATLHFSSAYWQRGFSFFIFNLQSTFPIFSAAKGQPR